MLLHRSPGVLVIAQPNEFRMPEVIAVCPFQKLDLRYEYRSNPNAFLHEGGDTL